MRQSGRRDADGFVRSMKEMAPMVQHRESEFARLLRLARAMELPEVSEGTSYGSPALKVRDKSFASVKGPGSMVLHCPPDQKELLLEMAPHIYWETDHYKGWPGLLVRLEIIGDEELAMRLADAWRFRAPRRLAATYAPRTPPQG
jgi:hypothetical protein